jgi:hypothetical protein
MFESAQALERQIAALLDAVRQAGEGRYAAVVEPGRILFQSAVPEAEGWMMRRFLESRTEALFALPQSMEAEGPSQDLFEDWQADEFLLAFINRRVAIVLVCPSAERAREDVQKPLKVLADRLLRYNQAWRMDQRGRGFFFGRPKVDLIVIGRSEG